MEPNNESDVFVAAAFGIYHPPALPPSHPPNQSLACNQTTTCIRFEKLDDAESDDDVAAKELREPLRESDKQILANMVSDTNRVYWYLMYPCVHPHELISLILVLPPSEQDTSLLEPPNASWTGTLGPNPLGISASRWWLS